MRKGKFKMKLLVTGANGYLGQGIVKAILDRGMNVVATDFCCDYVDTRAEIISCDLFAVENPFEFFGRPDALLHLAWRDGFIHYSSSHIDDLPKHFSFIRKMAEEGCKQICGMGSMHEIGFFEGSINETTPCHPITPYGIGKNALRELTDVVCKQNGAIFQWLRGFYIVGNSERGCSIFSKITSAEKKGEKEFPFTMGQNQYDFIDYDEFANQVATAVCQKEVNGIINVCSGKPEKLADRVERFITDNNYGIKLKYGAFPDRPYDSKAVWGDARKINSMLSYFKDV